MAVYDSTLLVSADWLELLGRFNNGLAMLAVTRRSLVQQGIADDEQASLLMGMVLLSSLYEDLDAAVNCKLAYEC